MECDIAIEVPLRVLGFLEMCSYCMRIGHKGTGILCPGLPLRRNRYGFERVLSRGMIGKNDLRKSNLNANVTSGIVLI